MHEYEELKIEDRVDKSPTGVYTDIERKSSENTGIQTVDIIILHVSVIECRKWKETDIGALKLFIQFNKKLKGLHLP